VKLLRAASCLSLVLTAFAAGSATADDRDGATLLALGDSVAFGYITQAGHQYVNARNFIGYPEYLSGLLHLETVNAACPGETSGSLFSASAPDNGCRAFRSAFPLHVAYSSTQLAFATNYLRHHRDVRVVTLAIGANDLFLLQDSCATNPDPSQCIAAGLPAALATIGQNVGTILAAVRGAGFGGHIVIVNYYSLDYSDPVGTGTTALLNQAETAAAKSFGAVVADVFTAFEKATSNPAVAGKTCNAGLLNVDPQDQTLCDVHPSQTGQQLMAITVARTHHPGW
jgi:lysophospholipase L1-like esterase